MQHVRVIKGADTGGVIPAPQHDWFLSDIRGEQARVQTLTMSGGTFSMWVPWASLEVVPNKVKLPGGNVEALTELTEWGNTHGVSVSATGALFVECPTILELIT